jgi:uridine monophosphate synthetase
MSDTLIHDLQQTNSNLVLKLFDLGMIKFGEFKLKSGKLSPIYIDLRTAISYPDVFQQICDALYSVISLNSIKYDFICGVPYSALAFASGIAYGHKIPMLLKRKEVKAYGTKKILEGDFRQGDRCLIIEDIVTTGESILETVDILRSHGLVVDSACALVERNQGGVDNLLNNDCKLYHLFDLHYMATVLYDNKLIDQSSYTKAYTILTDSL